MIIKFKTPNNLITNMLLPFKNYLNSLRGTPLPNEGGILLVQDTTPKVKTPSKKKAFGVFVTEPRMMNKRYIKSLLKEVAKYPKLQEASKAFWNATSISKAQFGDTIIFGDAPEGFVYDIRVEKDLNFAQAICKDKRVYDLIGEWSNVKKAISKYYTSNYPTKRSTSSPCVNVTVKVNVNTTPIKRQKSWEKVTIFHNFVKVGFDQFDILVDKKEKKYVIIDDDLFRIKRDIFGNKVLRKG